MTDKEQQIMDLVMACGEIMLQADREELRISSKYGSANFVTKYDTGIQEKLREGMADILPEAVFIGEEGEAQAFSDKGIYVIVDPIDGTTNFIKDYHVSCVSLGMIVDGKPEFGVVYNPYLRECYYAKRGEGAFLNGKPIHVSEEPLSNGVVLFGTAPYNDELNRKSFDMAFDYFKQALDIRRSGSAALDLCAIAAGRAELYFELILSPWDYAAGALIVEEAGGIVTTVEGEPIRFDRQCSLLAKNRA